MTATVPTVTTSPTPCSQTVHLCNVSSKQKAGQATDVTQKTTIQTGKSRPHDFSEKSVQVQTDNSRFQKEHRAQSEKNVFHKNTKKKFFQYQMKLAHFETWSICSRSKLGNPARAGQAGLAFEHSIDGHETQKG